MRTMKISEPEISKKVLRQSTSTSKEFNSSKEIRLDGFEHYGLFKHFIAGGAAGLLSRTTTAPLDRLKVFLQVHSDHNIPSALRYLYREGGFISFWRGNGINVAKIAPEFAFKFMAYEEIKRIVKRSTANTQLNMFDRFIAGGLAGAIAQTIIYPMEVLKTRLVLRKTGELDRGFKGLWSFANNMYAKEGILCFYKGFLPNLIGIFPYAGIDLMTYETTKNWMMRDRPEKDPDVLMILFCAIFSSTIAQTATYPLSLIRTRLQAMAIMHDTNQPSTMCGQVRFIYNNYEGLKGFYRGFIPNFIKVMPAVSISYLTYEECRRLLGAKMS